jgi:signal transduction histidine kinase
MAPQVTVRPVLRLPAALRRWPLRVRLTAAFTVAMGLVLVAVGASTLAEFRGALDESLEESLSHELRALQTSGDPHAISAPGPPEGARQVLHLDGTLASGSISLDQPLLSPAELAEAHRGPWRVDRTQVPGLSGPTRLAAGTTDDGTGVAVVAVSLAERDAALADLRQELAAAFPLILLASSVGAYLLAAGALRPVERMRAHAATITPDDRPHPLPVPPGHDEIARLGQTLNGLLARLHNALRRERQFITDASHELRTPLSLLTTELELATARPRSSAELREALHSALEETHRLTRLAEDLLLLARTDTARRSNHGDTLEDPIPLNPLLRAVATRFELLSATTRITVNCPIELVVRADPDDLSRLVSNLLDNALRHGRPPVVVTARLGSAPVATTPPVDPAAGGLGSVAALPLRSTVIIEVRDSGPGFDPAFLPHAFERFTRADTARTTAGTGLGLAISAAVLTRHGGTISAANHPAGGATITVVLPGGTPPTGEPDDAPPQ